jgi:hypothetical protein
VQNTSLYLRIINCLLLNRHLFYQATMADTKAKEVSISDKEHLEVAEFEGPSPSDVESDNEKASSSTPVDSASFHPNKAFYVSRFNIFSTEILVNDVSSSIEPRAFTDADPIPDSFRTGAKAAADGGAPVAFRVTRAHWFSHGLVMLDQAASGAELARWHHPLLSSGKATLTFPEGSPHASHELSVAPKRLFRRANAWVQDSVEWEWDADSRWKSNRLTLYKHVGGQRVVAARYAQPWGNWVAGGVLVVDSGSVDAVVATLTVLVMLKKMQQRAGERSSRAGGSGGP